jgi:hypothetical protein
MLQGRAVVEAHAEAQVKPVVAAGASTVLRVVLTADPVGQTTTDAAQGGSSDAAPVPRVLCVSVATRGLKTALGVRRARTLRLAPGGTAEAAFRLVGVDRGPGEVSIEIRGDHEAPLATLRLTIEVVGSDDHDQTGIARATADVPARPAARPPAATRPDVTAAGLGSTA